MKIKLICKNCHKEFELYMSQTKRGRGKYCSKKCKGMGWNPQGSNNWRWNGGRTIHDAGYILIKMPNHPRANYLGYIREHHLVMEKKLGRYLKAEEEVHHINRNKIDNRIENLQLFSSRSEHLKLEHKLGTYKNHLNKLNGGFYVQIP